MYLRHKASFSGLEYELEKKPKTIYSWKQQGERYFEPISSFVYIINYESKHAMTIENEEKITSDCIRKL